MVWASPDGWQSLSTQGLPPARHGEGSTASACHHNHTHTHLSSWPLGPLYTLHGTHTAAPGCGGSADCHLHSACPHYMGIPRRSQLEVSEEKLPSLCGYAPPGEVIRLQRGVATAPEPAPQSDTPLTSHTSAPQLQGQRPLHLSLSSVQCGVPLSRAGTPKVPQQGKGQSTSEFLVGAQRGQSRRGQEQRAVHADQVAGTQPPG